MNVCAFRILFAQQEYIHVRMRGESPVKIKELPHEWDGDEFKVLKWDENSAEYIEDFIHRCRVCGTMFMEKTE